MRIKATSLAAFLALPGSAVQADGLDPVLLACLAQMDFLAHEAELDAERFGEDQHHQAVRQFNALWEAFGHLLGQDDQCETPFEDVSAEVNSARAALTHNIEARMAGGETFETVYQDIWNSAQNCTAAVGQDALVAAHGAVQANGPPCGWGE